MAFELIIITGMLLADTENVQPKGYHFNMIKPFDVILHIFKLLNLYSGF